MKILIVADWHGEIYAQAVHDAFKNIGHETYRFSWKEYFKHCQYADFYGVQCSKFHSFYYRFQNRFTFGPIITKINKDFVASAQNIRPDFIFIYRGTHINEKSIQTIKSTYECKIYAYNNDDPFSLAYPSHFWRHYKRSLPYYDHVFSFRHKNLYDYKNIGITNTSLLRFYYLEENIFPISKVEKTTDVVFIGHFENDGRDETIKHLIDNGVDIKLFGPGWRKSKYYNYFYSKLGGDILPVFGESYNRTINESKIALVFLSKLNTDTYTTRNFEIPATKTMMMSEYTEDLDKNLYIEGKEAEYFRTKDELLEKIEYYLSDEKRIKKIGDAGFTRLQKDGHSVTDRVKDIISQYYLET